MWTANILVVNHALFMSDLALRRGRAGLLPDYDVAIFDEAHTLEAVAGEHLGLQVTSGRRRVHCSPGSTTSGRRRARWSIIACTTPSNRSGMPAGRPKSSSRSWRSGTTARAPASTAGSAGGRPCRTRSTKTCAGWPRRSAEGIDDVDEPEDRVELTGLQTRCLGLADQVQAWTRQTGRGPGLLGRGRGAIAPPHPAGRGAAGRRRDPAHAALRQGADLHPRPRRRSASARRRSSTS